ncbi:MAG: hypothetical protein GX856_08700 [Gammaproteobacteria bacterium]|nr:hypothetical protein [Gammaproteobacteria bacterium]
MNTRERAEALIEDLHDLACAGDVTEVMILARNAEGSLLAAYASDDMARFVDDARALLADVEAEMDGPACSRALN